MIEGLFTSESVSNGHPDKIADQISDTILDTFLEVDPSCRVACEAIVKTSLVILVGEIISTKAPDIQAPIRTLIKNIGYDTQEKGFDADSCTILSSITPQSPDIRRGIEKENPQEQGAGDQGTVFGYACDETKTLMPAPIFFAHALMRQHKKVRESKKYPWIYPDAKAQMTFRYTDGRPSSIDSVVVSTQHSADINEATVKEMVFEEIVQPVLPKNYCRPHTEYYINPAGRFVIGGPTCDAGLTGRKNQVDTYGGMARHGGGSLSGKDPSKVDRSGSYYARYIAKNIVAAKLATRCEVFLSYAIGIAEPIAVGIETFGTSRVGHDQLLMAIKRHFNPTPYGMIQKLELMQPRYQLLASYGHMGREDLSLPWERRDMADILKSDEF